MLKRTEFQEFEPLLIMRQLLTVPESIFLDRLVGCIGRVPTDQPHAATAIATLTGCLLEYAAQLGTVKARFADLLQSAARINAVVCEHRTQIEGVPPQAQMIGRHSAYPVWTLATELTQAHKQLRIALGAELARSVVQRRPVAESYCTKLRRDIARLGRRPTDNELVLPEDLTALGFGAKWIGSFRAIDKFVRRMVCSSPPSEPDAPPRMTTADLVRHLSYGFTYPAPSARKGLQHHGCLRPEALRAVARAVREGVEAGCDTSFVQASCMLTGFSVDAVLRIPLVGSDEKVAGVALALDGHCFFLELGALFPFRYAPDTTTAHLFEPSSSTAQLYGPAFYSREVVRRRLLSPGAATLGDLVADSSANARAPILQGDTSKLHSSLARCTRSMAQVGLSLGADRLTVAFQTWRFGVIPSARAYYARLLATEVLATAQSIYDYLEWLPIAPGDHQEAFGSRSVLAHAGVKQIFLHFANTCRDLQPGRRASLEGLLEHHNAYAGYTAAILTFALGAREAVTYSLMANELCLAQAQVVLRDKGTRNPLRALPVPVNKVARDQVRQWQAHCAALGRRLRDESDSRAINLRPRLEAIASCAPAHLLVGVEGTQAVALGSAHVWGSLPPHLRVPANVGRHFWQNALRAHGHSSRDIDAFMRHNVLMLDPNDSDHDFIASEAFNRIAATQERILADLDIGALSGLRRA